MFFVIFVNYCLGGSRATHPAFTELVLLSIILSRSSCTNLGELMTRIIALCTLFLLVIGCQVNNEILKIYPVSATHSGVVTVAKKKIPLLQGEWEVFATHSYLSTKSTPMLAFPFGNKDRNASIMAVTLSTNSDHGLGESESM
jgi:hypothetical protein